MKATTRTTPEKRSATFQLTEKVAKTLARESKRMNIPKVQYVNLAITELAKIKPSLEVS